MTDELPANPFIVGPPVPAEHFIGRQREVQTILARLNNPGNRGPSTIIGERRIGKTSLLHYVKSGQALASCANLSPSRAKFLYLNGHLIVPLVAEQFWKSVFSVLSVCQELEGNLRVLAQSMSQEVPSKDSLVDFFCKVGGARCLVVALFDEFDPVMGCVDPGNPEFFYTLRALLNQPPPRGFSLVVASRDPLDTLFRDVKWRGSEFYNNMEFISLHPFTRSEMDQLLDTYLEDSGIQFDNRLRNFLFEVSEGYPQAIQHGASILFDDIVRAKKEARRWRFSRKMRDIVLAALASDKPQPRDKAKGKQETGQVSQKDKATFPELGAKVYFASFDVFLAHHSEDKPQVKAIAEKLKERGLKPWLDTEQIPPGRWFQDIIQQAIRQVKSAAIFIGPNGLGKWQALELKAFISECVEAELPVIPILLPGVSKIPEELRFLRQLNWVRFKEKIDDPKALDSLEWGITGRRPREDL